MFGFGFGQSSSLFGQPSSTAGGNSPFGANATNPSSGSTTLMQTTGSSSILGGNSTSLFCVTPSTSSPSSASFIDINAPPSLFTNRNAPPLAGGSSLFGTVNSTAPNNIGFGGGSSTGSGGGSSLFGERPTSFGFKTTASGGGSSLFGETPTSFGFKATASGGGSSIFEVKPTSFGFKTTASVGGSSIFEVKPTSSGFNFETTSQQQSQPAPFSGFGPSNSSIATSTSSRSLFSSVTGFNSSNSSTPSSFNSSNSRTPALSGTSNGIGSTVVAYTPTTGKDESQEITMSFQSISAMPAYAHKSHEELRGGDYQSGDKGGRRTFPTASSNTSVNANGLSAPKPNLRQTSPATQFAPSSTTSGSLQTSSPSVFSPSNTNNPFAPSGTQKTISSSSSAFRPASSSICGFFYTSSATTTSTGPPFNAQPVETTNTLAPAPLSTSQCSVAVQSAPVTNPFGTVHLMPLAYLQQEEWNTNGRAGKSTTVYDNGDDIKAVLPKLRFPDYYTEPSIQELADKERAEPGFCSRVKDFVVGRHGCGNIKFLGETDVRGLDLDAIVQFNYGEVSVRKKLPSGKYLITLP